MEFVLSFISLVLFVTAVTVDPTETISAADLFKKEDNLYIYRDNEITCHGARDKFNFI